MDNTFQQYSRLSLITQPTNNTKRIPLIDFTPFYYLLNEYVLKILNNQKINEIDKNQKLDELGKRLGRNVMELIAAVQFDKIRYNTGVEAQKYGKYTEFIRFLCKEFWTYCFGQKVGYVQVSNFFKVSKLQMAHKGMSYDIEDKFDEQKRQNQTSIYPGFQMTRRNSSKDPNINDPYLKLWTKVIQGLVIGAMQSLGIECTCQAEFIQNKASDLKFTVMIIENEIGEQGQEYTSSFALRQSIYLRESQISQ